MEMLYCWLLSCLFWEEMLLEGEAPPAPVKSRAVSLMYV
jgi:hypothetical protein